MAEVEACPRCGGPLRQCEDDTGALSRLDDKTVICGRCGSEEAMSTMTPRGGLDPWAEEEWVREQREKWVHPGG